MGRACYFSNLCAFVGRLIGLSVAFFVAASTVFAGDLSDATLRPVGQLACGEAFDNCRNFDALVFVHGIYGDEATFRNTETNFYWPAAIPRTIGGHNVDVYTLDYRTKLIDWSQNSTDTTFATVAEGMFKALRPLRRREYRSIGFIAHSLGGNVTSAYLLAVKAARSTSGLAQHAFAITLATPVMGSQIANIASLLKSLLFMDDALLGELKENTSLQSLLRNLRDKLKGRAAMFGCREVNLHAAVETLPLAGMVIVAPESAAQPIASLTASPVVKFARDHSSIAKPADQNDEAYVWVMKLLQSEYQRIDDWAKDHPPDSANRYCEDIPFKKE